ncbi:ion transporter [Luminiphilus sp.]|nr:ion transporter [Luminiphilus sp.]
METDAKTEFTSRTSREAVNRVVNSKGFESVSLVLILISLVTFVVETIPAVEAQYDAAFSAAETIILALFTAEYILRLYASDGGIRYAKSAWGIIDLITILPFYLALGGFDGRPVRTFRLVRLFRLMKLGRNFSGAILRIRVGWQLAKEELIFALTGSLMVIFVSSVFIYFFERTAQPEAFGSVPDALWWAVVTFTTVGYGDATPITDGGKMFSFVVLLTALIMVGVPAGIVASALSMARETEAAENWSVEFQQEIAEEHQRLKNLEEKVEELLAQGNHKRAKQKLAYFMWKRALINPHEDSRQIYSTENLKPEHLWDLRQEEFERRIQELEDGEA